ncbi:MAG: signal peptidase I [Bacillota bacterium]|nr:signal peptidase I [Bacillota bacterium]
MKRTTIFRYAFLVFNIVFVLFIGLNLYFPEKAMDIFKFRPFIIVSDSMSPVIEIGDIVVIRQVDPKDLEVGDIISFNWDNRNIIHYLADIKEDDQGNLIFRSKNAQAKLSSDWDYWSLEEENIKGKSLFKIPKLGLLAMFLRSIQGMFALIVIVTVFLIRKMVTKYYEKK